MKPRPVTVYDFTVTRVAKDGDFLDVDATIRCSSGTYIRALARDLGAALGTGGHLAALRRTSVGAYDISQARTLDQLSERFQLTLLSEAAAAAFPRVRLQPQAHRRHTATELPLHDIAMPGEAGVVSLAAFAPDGSLVALVTVESDRLRSLAVFTSATAVPQQAP